MTTKAVFTLELEPDLRDTFMAEAAADDRPVAQVVRELMRGYIEQRRHAREYDEFLRRKVEIALADAEAGREYSNEEVEAEFSAVRDELLR
jgi:predicted transcriptional regulator